MNDWLEKYMWNGKATLRGSFSNDVYIYYQLADDIAAYTTNKGNPNRISINNSVNICCLVRFFLQKEKLYQRAIQIISK